MVDLRTLLALMLIADLILAAMLWIGSGRRLREDLALWSFALVAQALSFALFAIRGNPQTGLVALAATLLGLSFTLQAAALLSFDRRTLPAWVHTAVIAGVAAPVALLEGDVSGATLFGGLMFGTLLAMLGVVSWQLRTPDLYARGILAASFLFGSGAFFLRAVSALFVSDPMQGYVAPTFFQSALYLVGYAVMLGSTLGFVLLHQERADAVARRLATVDALTGAYNRLTFQEIAAREFSRARRAGQPLSLIMLDIDRLRDVNERHGQRAGDAVLKRFAEIARAALRKEDMLVRYGGEQFLVMLPEVPGPGAVVVAGRIRRDVEIEPFGIEGMAIAVTVSAGVAARLDEGPESIEELIAHAAEALALAKRRGSNRVVALSLGRSIAA